MNKKKRESDIPKGKCCMSCGNWELIGECMGVHDGVCCIDGEYTSSIEGIGCDDWHTSVVFHVMPIDDLKEHDSSCDCECRPTIRHHDDDGSALSEPIAIHHSWDGREAVEMAEEIIRRESNEQ